MHPSRVLPALRHARFWREFLSALLFVSLLLPAHAAAPQWWAQRGVIAPDKARDDFAAINQGQLKNLAAKAVAEMNAKLTGGAGTALNQRVASWSTNTAQADDFAGVNIGQAKAVARPVYERLLAAGAITALPSWITAPAASNQDFAAANIGQVKNLFAFEVPDQVGTSGTGGTSTNPAPGPVLPANSPFVISYHGWRSGSISPQSSSSNAPPAPQAVCLGTLKTLCWQMDADSSHPLVKSTMQTQQVQLNSVAEAEAWKSTHHQTPAPYLKHTVENEAIYANVDEQGNGTLQAIRVYQSTILTNGISIQGGPTRVETDYHLTAALGLARMYAIMAAFGAVTYESTGTSWTEATYQIQYYPGDVPLHWFKQEASGPLTSPAAHWAAATEVSTDSPLTCFNQPGEIIPYENMVLPTSGSLLATAQGSLQKVTQTYRNAQDQLVPSDRYTGEVSQGSVSIAWRTDLPTPLTTAEKEMWINRFKVVKTITVASSGAAPTVVTTALSAYITPSSTGSCALPGLNPELQEGQPRQMELRLVVNSTPPGGNPGGGDGGNPGGGGPGSGGTDNPPPVNPEGFTLQWEYPEKGIRYVEVAYSNHHYASGLPVIVIDDQGNFIPYPDYTSYGQLASWSTSFNLRYTEASYDAQGNPTPGTSGEGSTDPMIRLSMIPFPAYETHFATASQAIQVGASRRTVTSRNDFKPYEEQDTYCDYLEKQQAESRTRVRLKASTTLPAGYSLTAIPVVEETTLVQDSSGNWVPPPQSVPPRVTVKPAHVFVIPPGGMTSSHKEFDVPFASEGTSVVVRLIPVEINSRDRAATGKIPHLGSTMGSNKKFEIGFQAGSKSLGKYEIPQSGSPQGVHIYNSEDDIYSDSEFESGVTATNKNQEVILIREGGTVRFYTVSDDLGPFEVLLYLDGALIGTVTHEMKKEDGFDRMIAAAEKFIAGDDPLPIEVDYTEPPPLLAAADVPILGDVVRQNLANNAPADVLSEFGLGTTAASASSGGTAATTTSATTSAVTVWTDKEEFQFFVQRVFDEATTTQWTSFSGVLTNAGYNVNQALGSGQPSFNWQPGGVPVTKTEIDMPDHIRNRGLVARALMYWIKRLITAHVAVGEGAVFGVWDGVKGDVDGVVETLKMPVTVFNIMKDPWKAAGELHGAFKTIKEMGWTGVKQQVKGMFDSFMAEQQGRLDWVLEGDAQDPVYLNAYMGGYLAGYIGEQVAVTVLTVGIAKGGLVGKALKHGAQIVTTTLNNAGDVGRRLHKASKSLADTFSRTARSANEGRAARRSGSLCGSINGCLAAGTYVLMANGSAKLIDDVRGGDTILADNPNDGLPPFAAAVETQIGSRATSWIALGCDFNKDSKADQTLKLTPEHPVFLVDRGWVNANEVNEGDYLREPTGSTVAVCAVQSFTTNTQSFNLDVGEPNTFFASTDSHHWVLVHNGEFDIGPYNLKDPPFERHHPIMNIWMQHHLPFTYQNRVSASSFPCISLTKEQHRIATDMERIARATRPVHEMSAYEAKKLCEQIFDAVGVPGPVRTFYFQTMNIWLHKKHKNTCP
ncbi:MAG TPA: hypothetical protein DCP71_09480 [Verrucomicrobiales bacterium]|nr:hypothetical protein [Verrucomicrobiales bacterium]